MVYVVFTNTNMTLSTLQFEVNLSYGQISLSVVAFVAFDKTG